MIILYKFIQRGLAVNINTVIDKIINKICFCQFFILYDNINFYKSI